MSTTLKPRGSQAPDGRLRMTATSGGVTPPPPVPSPAPSCIAISFINPGSLSPGTITSLQFTVSGTVTPAPNPPVWPVQGYAYFNNSRYPALQSTQVSPTGTWTLSFDLSNQNPAVKGGMTGQLKVSYTDPNDPASQLISLSVNLQAEPFAGSNALGAAKPHKVPS